MTWYADLFHMYFKNLRSHKLSIEIPDQDTRKLSFDGSISEKCKPFFQIFQIYVHDIVDKGNLSTISANSGLILCFYLADFFDHVFNEDSIALCGVVDQNMRDGADELSILEYRAAAHALNDSAGLFEQLFIGHFDHHVFRCCAAASHHLGDLNFILLRLIAVDRCQNRCGPLVDLVA